MECASCGATVAPGATFCRACGESLQAPRAAKRIARDGAHAAAAHRAGALLLLAVPVSIVLFLAWGIAEGRMQFDGDMVITPGLTLAVVAPVAWGAWRGARWARPAALAVAALWAGVMAWALYDNLRVGGAAAFADHARARDVWLFVAHLGLMAAVALAFRKA